VENTTMNEAVRHEIAEQLGASIEDAAPLGGGDINDAWAVSLSDGRRVFVKTNRAAPPTMFPREAEGLEGLAEPAALRVPEVLAVSERFLALELIPPGRPAADHDERLGRGLAALHDSGAGGFGWPRDNFIGSLPQDNGAEDDWPTFYVKRRLEPQLAMAIERGRASGAMRRGFEALFAKMPDLVGPPEPPSRLHGDLWGGNLHTAETGEPVLIDPAVYGGHREMDLAMMRLFGGFGPRVFAAYEEARPLADGADERVALYQLYPLMVHVNLFGGSYVGSVERALSRYR
jgi:fructosamine-3-kinase